MCYFITALVNDEIALDKLREPLGCYLPVLEELPSLSIDMVDANAAKTFHFTGFPHCDCDSSLGRGAVTDEIVRCHKGLRNLKGMPKLRYLAVIKQWCDKDLLLKPHGEYGIEKIHIDDLEKEHLAFLRDGVFLKILYFSRRWL